MGKSAFFSVDAERIKRDRAIAADAVRWARQRELRRANIQAICEALFGQDVPAPVASVVAAPAVRMLTGRQVQIMSAMDTIARAMNDPGGEARLPMYERLERMLSALDEKESVTARARERAKFI